MATTEGGTAGVGEPGAPRLLGLDADRITIEPAGPVSGTVTAPASKSVTNRLLVLAALAEGESELARPLVSDDTIAMATGLTTLRCPVSLTPSVATVSGRDGAVGPPHGVVDAGLSGTTLRFLAAVSLLSPSPVTLDGDGPLRGRPLGGLLVALERAGARVRSDGGHAPVEIAAGALKGGRIVVDAAGSSQFATALLLVAPYARGDVELVAENLGAGGYVELTVEAMRRFGAVVEHDPSSETWQVSCAHRYRARDEEVEFDASAADHLFSLALVTGGEVTVSNVRPTLQPDAALLDVFAAMGATVTPREGGGATVRGPDRLRPVSVDLSPMPDQIATVAVLAALAEGTSRLDGLAVVRGHETDRLAAVATELGRLGVEVAIEGDSLVVSGGRALSPGEVETYHDHRMAMAFGVLGARVPGLSIRAPGCVAKTYPSFWSDLSALGVGISSQ